ncbi:hypothetical protein M3G18_04675 [Corynebacterium sp. p3-SID1145]|uniref:hypothetical protein n=1 Tax=unclassified Corynebacterium TaxID=2624378 RepID=UPI0021A9DAE5|nr:MULTISPECIES: hypothetical protein [unclassified Corynebacterium]MCT1452213.1 hypothetical protein [Corynebacterium sp. p3-SID1145]MCT1462145.1 hypothetical protein [Corynebacterium sp. p3-SID1140]
MRKIKTRTRALAVVVALAVVHAPAAATAGAAVPAMPQGYPIENFGTKCGDGVTPEWRYAETARRYLADGTVQFTNRTDQTVPYTATVETGTNHKIEANSKAALPNGWDTTAKTDIGLKESNGWIEGETFGPIKLGPGESFRVDYGVLEKDFISMFITCDDGVLQNAPGANVIRGTGPAERYAFAYIIKADGSMSNLAMEIPARAEGANSKPAGQTYTATSGPSLEKIASERDMTVKPDASFRRDADWPTEGQPARKGDMSYYPYDIEAVTPTFRKPGYSQDFLNWSKGDYTFRPVTDYVVGAENNQYVNWMGDNGRLPAGWLTSVGAVKRAYMPVGTELKPIDLKPGERVRVEYGTTMTRINYREISAGRDGNYSRITAHPQSSAPTGFWAEATVKAPDGTTRTLDVTPDEYRNLPVPTQSYL